jgi:hypothetical protein
MSTADEGFVESLDAGDAPGWKPEEGDVIVGTVVTLSKGWSDYKNGFYPIVTIQPDLDKCNPNPPRSEAEAGNPVAIHGFQFVLEDRFTALKPMPGERIGVKVGPKIPTKDGKRSVQTYTVKMDRAEDIWSDIKNPRLQGDKPAVAAGQTQMQTDDDIPF